MQLHKLRQARDLVWVYLVLRILEFIVWRLDALDAQVNDCLSAVMRGVRETTPKPLEAGQMAGGLADHGIHALRAHRSDRLITEVKGVVEKLNGRFLVDVHVPNILGQLGDFWRERRPGHAASIGTCIEMDRRDVPDQLAEAHLLRIRTEIVALYGHAASYSDREFARRLPMFHQSVLDGGLRENWKRHRQDGYEHRLHDFP